MLKQKPAIFKIGACVLFATGISLVIASSFFASSFTAMLGLALVFWGTILLYITPNRKVSVSLLNASITADTSNIERVLSELHSSQKGLYLPPRNLPNIKSSLIFVPITDKVTLPPLGEPSDKLYSKQKNAVFLTPPGLALSLLLEKELGNSFTKTDFTDLQKILPKLLTETLEIAENIRIEKQENTVIVEIIDSIFSNICHETNSQPQTHAQVGCLLSSALACILAKALGKTIIIRNETLTPETKTTTITYNIEEG